jgi:hypothetical protein
MANTGLKYAVSVADNASIGSLTWANVSNAVGNNTVDATNAYVLSGFGAFITHYLIATFSTGLSGSDTIVGVEYAFRRYSTNASGSGPMRDYSLRLAKNGSITGTEKSTSTFWPVGTGAWSATFGGPTDLHGLTLNGSDTIGVAVAGTFLDKSDTAYITAFRANFYYTSASGLKFRRSINARIGSRSCA